MIDINEVNYLGISVRPVNDDDREAARADFDRDPNYADYIVTMPDGEAYYANSDVIGDIMGIRTGMTPDQICDYMRRRINNYYLDMADLFGITGRALEIHATGDDLLITWEHDYDDRAVVIVRYADLSVLQIYGLWTQSITNQIGAWIPANCNYCPGCDNCATPPGACGATEAAGS